MTTPQNGWIQLQNNQFEIHDPSRGGQPALISAEPGVLLFVNECKVETPTAVFSRTSLRVTLPLKSPAQYHFEIEVSPNQLRAYVIYHEQKKAIAFALKDAVETQHLKVRLTDTPMPAHQNNVICEDLNKQLADLGISFGVQESHLLKALAHPGKQFCIAKGIQAQIRSGPFQIQYHLPWPQSRSFQPLRSPVLKALKKDTLIANLQEPACLSPGRTVFDQAIKPTPPSAPLKFNNQNLTLKNKGLFGLIDGIPEFHNQSLSLRAHQLISKLEADMGFHHFETHLTLALPLKKQVLRVKGHLECLNNQNQTHIFTQGHLILHQSTLKCTLFAGGDVSLKSYLASHLEPLLKQHLDVQKKADPQLNSKQTEYAQTLILNQTVQSQAKNLIQAWTAFFKRTQNITVFSSALQVQLKLLEHPFSALKANQLSPLDFHQWSQLLQDLVVDWQKEHHNTPKHIMAHYLQGSQLVADGNIYLLGEGAHQSHIQTQGDIYILGSPGYFRAGTLKAKGDIWVRVLGSPKQEVQVHLKRSGSLFAEKLSAGTQVYFGNQCHLIEKDLKQVRVYWHQGFKIYSEANEQFQDFWAYRGQPPTT